MESIFDGIEIASDKTSQFIDYLNNTQTFKTIYQSSVWNKLRRTLTRTDKVDEIISISEECVNESEKDFFCCHLVKYKYNGIVQEEIFNAHEILKLCKESGYPVTSHFSLEKLVKGELTSQKVFTLL